MATNRLHLNPRGLPNLGIAAAALALAACAATFSGCASSTDDAPEGLVPTVFRPQEPDAIEAAFPRESYPARLHGFGCGRRHARRRTRSSESAPNAQ